MIYVDIAPLMNPVVSAEIKAALKRVSNGVVRMIRVPVEDFNQAVNKAVERNPFTPFSPVVFGIPCDMTINVLPEIIVVHDDNTNGLVNTLTESGIVS